MFKFDFDLQGSENDLESPLKDLSIAHDSSSGPQEIPLPPFMVSTLEDLIEDLPPLISYSPLRIPLPGNLNITLLRRDLFDARFQQISEDKVPKDLSFIDAPSDLVPGVYEGGLKTWECSADLAGYLDDVDISGTRRPLKILEIGCGTALPSLNLLRKVFNEPRDDPKIQGNRIILHLQDYNLTVLQLMTLPNIILNASPASISYRTSESLHSIDPSEPGELAITAELISSFLESLREHHIELTFFSGAWKVLETRVREARITYDLVVSSETIYQSASLPSLASLLKAACTSWGHEGMVSPPSSEFVQLSSNNSGQESVSSRCLIAAKVIYFGVGGGIDEFERVVNEAGGRLNTVFEKKEGVGRRITSLDWSYSV